jgi:hypothetical protein
LIDAATAALRDVATVDLYRRNAFHVTGLPTDADRRTIRRWQQQVVMALSVGADLPGSAEDDDRPGPAEDADPDEIRAAFSLLEDPRRRLVEEFFWYWNADRSRCGCDPVVHETHNQAVVAHFHILHQELARNGEEPDAAAAESLRQHWITAGRWWKAALAERGLWTHMRHRVKEIDEPQLTNAAVDALVMEMPAALLRPLIDLIARTERPTRLIKVARNWPVAPSILVDLLEPVATPLAETIRTELADTLRIHLDGGTSAAVADRLLTDVVPAVRRLNALEPHKSNHRTASLRDSTAIALNNCAITLLDDHRRHQDEPVDEWLGLAKKLACDREIRREIGLNLYAAEQWRMTRERLRTPPTYAAPARTRPPNYSTPPARTGPPGHPSSRPTPSSSGETAGCLVQTLVVALVVVLGLWVASMCVSGQWKPFSAGPLRGIVADAVADHR